MLFIRANTLFNIHTPSVHLISLSACPNICMPHHAHRPQWPFIHLFCQLMHKQPPSHYSGIPALVPGGAMCTPGMAMLGSAFLQPTGYMLHVSKCSIVIDFCTKPCRAGLFSISAMSVRKFPFWDKFRTCSTQCLGTAFCLFGPRAPLFLSPPISCPVCHLRPTHLSVCHSGNSRLHLSTHLTIPSGLRAFFPFLDKPSELRHVSVHHRWTTSYLTGPGALLFLSPSISVPLCQFRPIHPSVCQLPQL